MFSLCLVWGVLGVFWFVCSFPISPSHCTSACYQQSARLSAIEPSPLHYKNPAPTASHHWITVAIQGLYMCHVSSSVTSITSLLVSCVCMFVVYLPTQKCTPVLSTLLTCLPIPPASSHSWETLCLCPTTSPGYLSSHLSQIPRPVSVWPYGSKWKICYSPTCWCSICIWVLPQIHDS